jgi:hypothetical protein
MHHDDIVAVLIGTCRDEILRRFLKRNASRGRLTENLPSETTGIFSRRLLCRLALLVSRQTDCNPRPAFLLAFEFDVSTV